MIKSTFELEKKLLSEGYRFIIGIDEAGRGPLAGPVVACAAVLKCHSGLDPESSNIENINIVEILKQVQDDRRWDLIRDSKLLSPKQREKIFDFIQENFYFGIGICDHKTIDRMNILEASFLAMKAAVSDLIRIMNYELRIKSGNKKTIIHDSKSMILLVDGNKKIPNLSMEQRAIVNGDKIVKSISAASIVAKVTRDRMMMEMHSKFPDYGFNKHKGYGTKLHMSRLKTHGPCQIHRRSFEPVSTLVKRKK